MLAEITLVSKKLLPIFQKQDSPSPVLAVVKASLHWGRGNRFKLPYQGKD